jgi:RNA polymerase sigma factor (sigma-70 family)
LPSKLPADTTNANVLVDHLFRHEAGKMVSVLTRIFGLKHIEIAEDIVQDTFLKALDEWSFHKIPENPPAWLYRVAKNRTIDIIRHQKYVAEYEQELNLLLKSEWTLSHSLNNLFLDSEIEDSQLRMIFASCHPELPKESQIALTLKTLCGFSVGEISRALLTTDANINKRLFRAKQKLRDENLKFEIPAGKSLNERLDSVYKVIYLLFNEGYKASDSDTVIRKDLCAEAIRLCKLLAEHLAGNKPKTYALLALMCFHAARLDARLDDNGFIILLKEQDRTKWDKSLISKGYEYLNESSEGDELSEYHLEAGIAANHASASSFEDTDWDNVLKLYDMLVKIHPSPVTYLNRAIVIGQINGAKAAIAELDKIKNLEEYYLYHTTFAEFYSQLKQNPSALKHLNKALKLTKSKAEKKLIEDRIETVKKA